MYKELLKGWNFNMANSKIIVVEGPQGAGKTTVTDYIRHFLPHTNLYRLCGTSDKTASGKEKATKMYFGLLDYIETLQNDSINLLFDRTFFTEEIYCRLGYKEYSFSDVYNELLDRFASFDFDFYYISLYLEDENEYAKRLLRDNKGITEYAKYTTENSINQQNAYLKMADEIKEKYPHIHVIKFNNLIPLEEMQDTKNMYGKTDKIKAFHAVQSFREGEVTPEQAHEIGVQLANEMWKDRFEVLVTTHVNTKHIHNHFVILRDKCRSCGLFAYYKHYLGCMRLYLSMGYIPLVDLKSFKNIFNGFNISSINYNPFEYYFNQPFEFKLKDVEKNAKNIKYVVYNNSYIMPYYNIYRSNFLIDYWHNIAMKSMPIKIEIIKEANIINRGTDYLTRKPKFHPRQASIKT